MPEERQAISYTRFSAGHQGCGDSTTRQARAFANFCKHHKLKVAAEHFADHGRSGWKATHRSKGDLGRFEALVKNHTIPRGSVLVIEAWDRLSRERPDKAIRLISEILAAGVDIGVTRLDDIFTEEDLGTHKFTTLSVFVQLAYQESKQKSERSASSWKSRQARARAERRPATGRTPAWIEARNGKLRLIPDRAAAVKRIFELAAAGNGQSRIVRALTAEGIKPFGERKVSEGRTRSCFSGTWAPAYIRLILNDRRAVGEYTPRKGGKPDGPPIPAYYPAAITEQEFLLARMAQESRKVGRKAPRQRTHINVFAGLLRNAEDGEGFRIGNTGTAEAPRLILRAASGVEGRGKTVTFPYPLFEHQILSCLREIDTAEVTPDARPTSRLDVLKAEKNNIREQIDRLREDLRKGYSPTITSVLREQEDTLASVEGQLAEEEAKAAHPAERDWTDLRTLADLLAEAEDKDDVRIRLRTVLRRRISEIWVRIISVGAVRLVAAQVWFAGDKLHRDYLLRYRGAGKARPEQVSPPKTFAAADGALDLRDRKQAEQLARDLAAAELAD